MADPAGTERPGVAIYRHNLLPWSETFIVTQAEALTRYAPHYVGCTAEPGIELPAQRVTLVDQGSWRGSLAALVFLTTGRSLRAERAIAARRSALVHAHFDVGGIAALPLAARAGIPLVVTCHGFDVTVDDAAREPNRVRRAVLARRRRSLHARTALFVAVSEHLRDAMVARGYPEERTVVHYIGTRYDPADPEPLEARRSAVLFVGRLVEKKGAADLLRAMVQVHSLHPDTELTVCGDGPLRADLQALAAEVRVPARFIGRQPAEVVSGLMSTHRVLCVPTVRASNHDEDGLPAVFVEAQAAGLPVVAYSRGGNAEVIRDGESGLLAPPGDVGALARAISALLADEALWRKIQLAGRRNVAGRFNLTSQTAKLEAFYDEMVARPRIG